MSHTSENEWATESKHQSNKSSSSSNNEKLNVISTWSKMSVSNQQIGYDAYHMLHIICCIPYASYHVNLSKTILDKWAIDICSIYSWWPHVKKRLERIVTN